MAREHMPHPVEIRAMTAVERGIELTAKVGETNSSIARLLGTAHGLVADRRAGRTPWRPYELCTIADHWDISWCAMVNGPAAVEEELTAQHAARVRPLPTSYTRPRVRSHLVDSVMRAAVGAMTTLTGERQRELAAVVGSNQGQMAHRQRGAISWPLADLGRLADHWGVDVCALYGGPGTLIDAAPWARIVELRAQNGMPELTHAMPA